MFKKMNFLFYNSLAVMVGIVFFVASFLMTDVAFTFATLASQIVAIIGILNLFIPAFLVLYFLVVNFKKINNRHFKAIVIVLIVILFFTFLFIAGIFSYLDTNPFGTFQDANGNTIDLARSHVDPLYSYFLYLLLFLIALCAAFSLTFSIKFNFKNVSKNLEAL